MKIVIGIFLYFLLVIVIGRLLKYNSKFYPVPDDRERMKNDQNKLRS